MNNFMKPLNFELYDCDMKASNGVMDNMYTVIQLPKEDAKKLIPKGTYLAEQTLTSSEFHPIFLFFTHNKFGFNIEYRELLVGVPFVKTEKKLNSYEGMYTYMPRLYLNEDLPRVSGNIYYGYEKLAATVEDNEGGKFQLYTLTDKCHIAGTDFSIVGDRKHPKEYENMNLHKELFHMPFITQASRRSNPDIFSIDIEDDFLISWIDYDFDHPDARMTPLKGSVEIGHLFTPAAFPRGKYQVNSIVEDTLGSFRIEIRQHCSSALPIDKFTGVRDWDLALSYKSLIDNSKIDWSIK